MTYAVLYGVGKAPFQIVEVPEGSSADDVNPEDRPLFGSGYGSPKEAQQAIDAYKKRSRPDAC